MNLRESVLATIAYHDIFDYPLKTKEVAEFLIEHHASLKKIEQTLDSLISEKRIGEFKGFYYLINREKIIKIRLARTKHSSQKLKRATFYSKTLKLIPSIHMVGISGALAMGNSHAKDDIDLVIITRANCLWTTRLLSSLLLFPVKRKPGTTKSNNSACLNLFIDESDLKIKDKNIYQAHEICQLKPLWQRNSAYTRFIKANKWVCKYLPNWQPVKVESGKLKVESKSRGKEEKFSIFNSQFSILESLLRNIQLFYMKKKISTEQIGEHQLFFHPANTQEWVLEEYKKRLKRLNIKRNID